MENVIFFTVVCLVLYPRNVSTSGTGIPQSPGGFKDELKRRGDLHPQYNLSYTAVHCHGTSFILLCI